MDIAISSTGNGTGKKNGMDTSQLLPDALRVGTRKSQLALVQTNYVVERLREINPEVDFPIIGMDTIGDDIQAVALSKIGEKSLFTRELEVALQLNKVDFVVHSLKDLPTTLPDGMTIAAILARENPLDAVVLRQDHDILRKIKAGAVIWTLNDLPEHSVIGTSSLRRAAQIKRRYPQLRFQDVRGNLNSRLKKLDDPNHTYDALILATAGLARLGWHDRISLILPVEDCLYAVGQGALAIECRSNDVKTLSRLRPLIDADTTICCVAERAFLKHLEGGCSVPCAVSATFKNNVLVMNGGVYSLDGFQAVEDSVDSDLSSLIDTCTEHFTGDYVSVHTQHLDTAQLCGAVHAGIGLAKKLEAKGAMEILAEARLQTRTANAINIPTKRTEGNGL